jgi:hypothetical protein
MQCKRISSPRTRTSPEPSNKVIPIKKLDARIEPGHYVAGNLRDAEGMKTTQKMFNGILRLRVRRVRGRKIY